VPHNLAPLLPGKSYVISTHITRDNTQQGGVIVALAERFKIPIYAIGVGEQAEDLQPFEAEDFAKALVGEERG